MNRSFTIGAALAAMLVGGALVAPAPAQNPTPDPGQGQSRGRGEGQGRGQGMRGRPGDNRTPEFPPPTIVEYKPRNTLVVPAHFDYYRDYHAFWKLYGMGLPDAVLKKLYYKNALTLVPGLPKDKFPS